jgi:hypothetical protein
LDRGPFGHQPAAVIDTAATLSFVGFCNINGGRFVSAPGALHKQRLVRAVPVRARDPKLGGVGFTEIYEARRKG